MNRLHLLALALLICFIYEAKAQEKDTIISNCIALYSTPTAQASIPSAPTSPQAEAFKRLGEFTVNNSSGIPDISIPLFELDHCGYKIPITLRYIPTPIKPGYNYDVCGFGWTLSTSYCISRTIESLPDEEENFKLSDFMALYYKEWKNSLSSLNFAYDKFHANLPNGKSFDFAIVNENGKLVYKTSETTFLQISCRYNEGNIYSFEVIDEAGIKYTFDDADCAYSRHNQFSSRYVSWYLSSIVLPNSSTPILFNYDQTIKTESIHGLSEPTIYISHKYPSTQSRSVEVYCEQSDDNCYYKMKLLKSIETKGASISFDYINKNAESSHNCISKINYSDYGYGKTIKLDYDTRTLANYVTRADTLSLLSKIAIIGLCEGKTDSLTYTLKNSYTGYGPCTDHWGYYGQNGNYYNIANINFFAEFDKEDVSSNPIIKAVDKLPTEKTPYTKFNMAGYAWYNEPRQSSDPNENGILKEITYPNGGKTAFAFENHRFVTATDKDGNYIFTKKKRRIIEGGGYRIRQISNIDNMGKIKEAYTFAYGPTNAEIEDDNLNMPLYGSRNMCVGYGEPVVDPNVLTYASFSESPNIPAPIKYMLLGYDSPYYNGDFVNPFKTAWGQNNSWLWECRFSALNFRKLLNGRNAVVYPQITVYYGDAAYSNDAATNTKGKTVYKYAIYDTEHNNDSTYYETLSYHGNTLACFELPYKRNRLTEKVEYKCENGQFQKTEMEQYGYSDYAESVTSYIDNNCFTKVEGGYPEQAFVGDFYYTKVDIYGNSLLHEKKQTKYEGSYSWGKSFVYKYDSYNQIVEQPDGDFSKRRIKTEYVTSDSTLMSKKMVEKHLLSAPTSSYTYMQYSGLNGLKTEYDEYDIGNKKAFLPSKLYDISFYGQPVYEEKYQILNYTSNAHPIEIVDAGGIHTIYLWSYADRYLIAEIKNANYEQANNAVREAFGVDIVALSQNKTVNVSALARLRASQYLQNAMVSTWTYQPSVGIKSETSPNGNSTFYSYDGLGRLTEIYRYKNNSFNENDKEVLEQHSYYRSNK